MDMTIQVRIEQYSSMSLTLRSAPRNFLYTDKNKDD